MICIFNLGIVANILWCYKFIFTIFDCLYSVRVKLWSINCYCEFNFQDLPSKVIIIFTFRNVAGQGWSIIPIASSTWCVLVLSGADNTHLHYIWMQFVIQVFTRDWTLILSILIVISEKHINIQYTYIRFCTSMKLNVFLFSGLMSLYILDFL